MNGDKGVAETPYLSNSIIKHYTELSHKKFYESNLYEQEESLPSNCILIYLKDEDEESLKLISILNNNSELQPFLKRLCLLSEFKNLAPISLCIPGKYTECFRFKDIVRGVFKYRIFYKVIRFNEYFQNGLNIDYVD